ncbi:MAG: hypothetical protein AAF565_05595 [Pseudomonadota bacterium]
MQGDEEAAAGCSPASRLVQRKLHEAVAELRALPAPDRLALTNGLARRMCLDLMDGSFEAATARARLLEISALCQISSVSLDRNTTARQA